MKPKLSNLLASENLSLKKVLKIIQKNTTGTAFVISKNKKIKGLITDGDIRRLILKNKLNLNEKVKKFCNKKFKSLNIKSGLEKINNCFSKEIRILPLVNDNNIIIDYALYNTTYKIPIAKPSIGKAEKENVLDCINNNWISSQGKYVESFEKNFKKQFEIKYALAVSSGTAALQLAIISAGIKKGDEVIVPNLTFAASVNSIIHSGAKPVLVDVNPNNWTIDPEQVKKNITKRTKAIMAVHLYGHPAHMSKLKLICKKYKLLLIADCAESLGATYKKFEKNTLGDLSTFSFFGNKMITTGEGGMILFKNKHHYEKAKILRDHGMSKSKKYYHVEVGFNFRMTNIQAAVGVAQLAKVQNFLKKRRKNYQKFFNKLISLKDIKFQKIEKWAESSFWLYTILLNEKSSISKAEFLKKLEISGVETRPIFYPFSLMKIYKKFIKKNQSFPVSEKISKNGLSLPSFTDLNSNQINYICENIKKAIGKK